MRKFLAATSIALTAAGCAGPAPAPEVRPAPVVVAPPRPTPAPAPLASDWNDWPFTPGEWRYEQMPTVTRASFRNGSDVVSFHCDRARRQVSLFGIVDSPVTIRTTTLTRTVTPTGNFRSDQPVISVALAATDPLLDAIAFSRGRFVIEQAGSAPLVLPPHAEIGRVIEDCRG